MRILALCCGVWRASCDDVRRLDRLASSVCYTETLGKKDRRIEEGMQTAGNQKCTDHEACTSCRNPSGTNKSVHNTVATPSIGPLSTLNRYLQPQKMCILHPEIQKYRSNIQCWYPWVYSMCCKPRDTLMTLMPNTHVKQWPLP